MQLDSISQVSGGNATRHWMKTETGSCLSSYAPAQATHQKVLLMECEQRERWLWGPRMSQQLSAFLIIQWQQRSKGKGQGVELKKNKGFQKFTFI